MPALDGVSALVGKCSIDREPLSDYLDPRIDYPFSSTNSKASEKELTPIGVSITVGQHYVQLLGNPPVTAAGEGTPP